MLLVAAWTSDCEGAPNENKGETSDLAKMKKELEDQKASLEKYKTDLEHQFKTDLEQQKEELRRELREEMEKEKIANVELRKADAEIIKAEVQLRRADEAEEEENKDLRMKIAAKRQNDVLVETKKLIVSEIEKYLANTGICDMGSFKYDGQENRGYDNREFKIHFEKAFPRKPKMATALKSFGKNRHVVQFVRTDIRNVTRTSATFYFQAYYVQDTTVAGTWIACI